jgi:hypothetical protein
MKIAIVLAIALAPTMAHAKCWGTKHDLRSGQCHTLKEARKAHPTAHLYYSTKIKSSPSPSSLAAAPSLVQKQIGGFGHMVDPSTYSPKGRGEAQKAHPSPWIIGTRSIPFLNVPGTHFRYYGPDSTLDDAGTRFGDSPWWWRLKYPFLHALTEYPR